MAVAVGQTAQSALPVPPPQLTLAEQQQKQMTEALRQRRPEAAAHKTLTEWRKCIAGSMPVDLVAAAGASILTATPGPPTSPGMPMSPTFGSPASPTQMASPPRMPQSAGSPGMKLGNSKSSDLLAA